MNVLETKNMNRQQRRQAKKQLEWVNSLTPEKQKIIDTLIELEVKKTLGLLISQVETCICATIIENFENLDGEITYDKINKLLKDFDDYLVENGKFVRENGDWEMKVKELEPKLVERIEGLLEEKITQKKIIEMMKKEFTELTSSHIRNAFQQAKENVKARKEEAKKDNVIDDLTTTEEAVNYIFADELQKEKEQEEEPAPVKKENKKKKEEKGEGEMIIKGKTIPKELEIKGVEPVETDIKGLLNAKLKQTKDNVEKMEKDLKELELKLGKSIVDVEKLQQAIELLSDIEL